ncbi:MAG TPA: fumarate hydratase, partial [Myxococcaceae bacterium]|nr:fumarate hydratase [Myxococcaceae bacterium]
MGTPAFQYQDPFPLAGDPTRYRLLTREGVSLSELDGVPVLKIAPETLERLAREALREVSFFLRPSHNQQVARILWDAEASENDRWVALAFLRNAEIAARGELPLCQDTGTSTIVAWKGQQIWTGGRDAEHLSRGIYRTFTEENLRYSQAAPLDMYREVNTGTNLPAQIDIYATDGAEYRFLFLAKGGGSANKTMFWQETKALLAPPQLEKFLVEKIKQLGTAACPPYHIAVAVGGTSAEQCVKTVKLASTRYYDELPTRGN